MKRLLATLMIVPAIASADCNPSLTSTCIHDWYANGALQDLTAGFAEGGITTVTDVIPVINNKVEEGVQSLAHNKDSVEYSVGKGVGAFATLGVGKEVVEQIGRASVEQVAGAALRNTNHLNERLNKLEDMVNELDAIKANK